MQTDLSYCASCGHQVYEHQEFVIDVHVNHSYSQIRHAVWQGCQESMSIMGSDSVERDRKSREDWLRGRRSGLHFQ